jgi:DNA-binding MarR family transcriptional regulator
MEKIHTTNALRLLQAADDFRARLSGEFSSVHGVSVNEFLLLMHLETATKHRLPRVELAKRMHVSASTVTRMVAPMEKIGLVERFTDARDARLAFVVIADAGRERLAEALATFSKQAGYLFDERWDVEETEKFAAMLHRFTGGTIADLTQ